MSIDVSTTVDQFLGVANYNVYKNGGLITTFAYDNNTKLTSVSALLLDLDMLSANYVTNTSILYEWVNRVYGYFSLNINQNLTTSRNYEYTNGDRKMDAFITANEFKVKYKQSNDTITIRARNAFTFNISELIYFAICHKDFSQKNDLF